MLRAELTVPEVFRCVTRSLMNVAPRTMAWVWQDWIPRGGLSLVLGEPGVGKSLYSLELAAMVTQGLTTLPQSRCRDSIDQVTPDVPMTMAGTGPQGAAGTVVLFEPGDSGSILRTRLEGAGADIEKIVLIERNWQGDSPDEVEEFLAPEPREPAKRPNRIDKDRELRRDLQSLEQHVVQLRQAGHDVSLVIIDPIESLLRDSIDKHRLARLLSELADQLNVAIVAVGTTSSSPRAYPGLRLDRNGIDVLFKASNTVVTVARDPENILQRLVQPTKLNLSAAPPGLTFAFTSQGTLEWSQTTTSTTEQDAQQQSQESYEDAGEIASRPEGLGKELNRAKQWLKTRLSDGGVLVATVRSDARQHGISKATLRRAYDQLGCVSKKSWGSSSGQWVWWLPESTAAIDSNVGDTPDVACEGQTETRDPAQRANGVSVDALCH